MWWYCGYRALPKVRASDLARRFLRQHDAGTNQPASLRGWFAFPSGLAGFVLIEAETPREVAAIVEPYARLVTWDVQAVAEQNYNQVHEELRRSTGRAALDDLMAGVPPAELVGNTNGSRER
jgi:hypothetical protein